MPAYFPPLPRFHQRLAPNYPLVNRQLQYIALSFELGLTDDAYLKLDTFFGLSNSATDIIEPLCLTSTLNECINSAASEGIYGKDQGVTRR
jgi:hypothetical protein